MQALAQATPWAPSMCSFPESDFHGNLGREGLWVPPVHWGGLRYSLETLCSGSDRGEGSRGDRSSSCGQCCDSLPSVAPMGMKKRNKQNVYWYFLLT